MLFLLITILVVTVDQLTKKIISSTMLHGESIPIFKNIFHLTFVHNRGAAFGIFTDQTIIFIWTSIVTIILILSILVSGSIVKYKTHEDREGVNEGLVRIVKISLALILGGAIGNLIDRLKYGFVMDFLDFRCWPVFNLADSAITVGAILLLWQIVKKRVVNRLEKA